MYKAFFFILFIKLIFFSNNINNNNDINKLSVSNFAIFPQVPDNNKQLAYGDFFLKVSANLDNFEFAAPNNINNKKLNNNNIIINNILTNNNNINDIKKEKKTRKVLTKKIIINNDIMNNNISNANANNTNVDLNRIKNNKRNEQEDFDPLLYGHPEQIRYKTVKQKLNIHKKLDKECREDTFILLHSIEKLKKSLVKISKEGKIQDKEKYEQLKELYTKSILSLQHKLYAQNITGHKME